VQSQIRVVHGSAIESICHHCAALPPGPVADARTLERAARRCLGRAFRRRWQNGSHKLLNRMEKPIWNPPILTFRIERHGAAALGSSRAEVQEWTVDLERMTTTVKVGWPSPSPPASAETGREAHRR
jgi:hypothetical protein